MCTREYDYDQYGRLAVIRDPKGRETQFTYDELGRQITRTLPMGQMECQSYNSLGQLQYKVDFKGQVTEFLYDTFGRLSERRLFSSPNPNVGGGGLDGSLPPVGSSGDSCDFSHIPSATPNGLIQFSYDQLGRQSQISESSAGIPAGITSFSYDPDGRLVSISSPEGTVFYEYDRVTGRKERTFTANSDVLYDYDELGRLSAVSVLKQNGVVLADPQVTTYGYNDIGTRAAINYANGTRTTYQYDSLNRLTNLTNFSPSNEILSSYSYSLLANGRRSAVTETRLESDDTYSTTGIQWTYDGLNRLIREGSGSDLPEANYTTDYVYDLVGNRLSKSSNVLNPSTSSLEPETFTYNYNSNDQLLEESFSSYNVGGTPSAESRLTTYDYDPNGSLISKLEEDATSNQTLATSNYSYSLDNRLSSAQISRTETVNDVAHQVAIATNYLYNQSGIRVRSNSTMSVDSGPAVNRDTVFLLDSNNHTGFAQVLEEYSPTSATAPSVSYTIGDDIIAQSTGTSPFTLNPSYFVYDGHGSTRLLTDTAGQITDRYSFDAYGILIGPSVGVLNTPTSALLYSGEQFDVDLQQQYLRERFYDQNNGRFTRIDPLGSDVMGVLYLYCSNDPVNCLDPSGLYEIDVHQFLTIFLAKAAGFSGLKPESIGLATQKLDRPEDPRNSMKQGKPIPNYDAMRNFHFVSRGRMLQLRTAALSNYDDIDRIGEYVHALEDTYSHSTGIGDRNWIYHGDNLLLLQRNGGLVGHGHHGHEPDHTWNDVNKGMKMAKKVYDALRDIVTISGTSGVVEPWSAIDIKVRAFLAYEPSIYKQYYGGVVPVTNATAEGYNQKVKILDPSFNLPDDAVKAHNEGKGNVYKKVTNSAANAFMGIFVRGLGSHLHYEVI